MVYIQSIGYVNYTGGPRMFLFRTVGDVDLWPLAMMETPVTGGILGPTFATIIAKQFHNYKYGDRFYFETADKELRFSPGRSLTPWLYRYYYTFAR